MYDAFGGVYELCKCTAPNYLLCQRTNCTTCYDKKSIAIAIEVVSKTDV